MLKQMAEGYVAPGEKLGTASTFALGGMAGFITVCVEYGFLYRYIQGFTDNKIQIRNPTP